MPEFDFVERHDIEVNVPPEKAFNAVKEFDAASSPLIASLLLLRTIPHLLLGKVQPTRQLDLAALSKAGFVTLDEVAPHELVLGVVGKFWQLDSGLRATSRAGFVDFDEPGFARATWNFTVEDLGGGRSRIATETRIACTDEHARSRFKTYWRLIGPFSALIRRRMLAAIKKSCERG